jgi:hypothetical protein
MVKLIPDFDSATAIVKSVLQVVRWYKDYKVQIIGLHPNGEIAWYQGHSAVREYRALPLAVYTTTKYGIQVAYEPIVQKDEMLFDQFEEALRVAMLNSSST